MLVDGRVRGENLGSKAGLPDLEMRLAACYVALSALRGTSGGLIYVVRIVVRNPTICQAGNNFDANLLWV